MKVTRKMPSLGSLLAKPEKGEDDKGEEMAPSLFLHHLPGEIPNMPEKGDFEGHVKGKVRRHSSTTEEGKTHHSYDLDVHHFECHNKKGNGGKSAAKPEAKKRKSDKEELDEAFDKHFGPKNEKR